MKDQMSSEPNEPARAGYDAPRAQRLSDAVRASGGQCIGHGQSAHDTCANGNSAIACLDNGNSAYQGCVAGESATECGTGMAAN